MTEQEKREKAIDELYNELYIEGKDNPHTLYVKCILAINAGYRKEDEVRNETLQKLFSSVSSLVETTMKYSSLESPIIHLSTLKMLIKQEFGIEVEE